LLLILFLLFLFILILLWFLLAERSAVLPSFAVSNFGGNTTFRPNARYFPRSEADILDILRTHRGRRLRAVGRLHSWSEATVCEDVLLDLRHLDSIIVHANDSSPYVEVGAGCQIKRLLRKLQRTGHTLPSLGLVDEQSVAGAIATGTHGSGRNSLSHYVQAVRLAYYDPQSGESLIREIASGNELRAARCALGSLGIVTSVVLQIRPQYQIEEHFRCYERLEQVLEQEAVYDLQQFFLIPWRWDFMAQHRREVDRPPSRIALLYRLYWLVGMDVGLHIVVRLLARWLPGSWTPFCYRQVIPRLVPQGWKVVDRSDRQLTMQHELFRHIEIEVFVTRSRLTAAIEFVVWLVRQTRGETIDPPNAVRERLQGSELWERCESLKGQYLQHYPICIRKVLPDDTLISMSSGGNEPYYALSFISYAPPHQRQDFLQFADVLAATMALLFDARPHWGKVCPLSPEELNRLYPGLETFAAIQKQMDPADVFRNAWVRSILGAAKATTGEPGRVSAGSAASTETSRR
jgi:FAD/FMN-containing dehydrogenase